MRSDGLHLRYRSTPMIVSKSFRAASVSAAEIFFASITFVCSSRLVRVMRLTFRRLVAAG
jgi:hypothetical protein